MDCTRTAADLVKDAQSARGTDWPRAASLAAELREAFPDNPAGYQIGSASARELGRLDEAATIVAAAVARFPAVAWPVAEAAWTARALGDAREAVRLAADLRDRFPDNPAGYHLGSATAREMGRSDEATAILADAAARFPAQPWLLSEAAWTARARGDTEAALRLAADMRDKYPDTAQGYHIGSASARDLGRFDEAAAILEEAAARFPAQAWPIAEAAWTARARGDFAAAARLAAGLRERFPSNANGYHIGSMSARDLGRFDEAASILEAARAQLPAQPWMLAEAGWTAKARGDIDAAIALAAELRGSFPDHPVGYQLGAFVLRVRNRLQDCEDVLREAAARFPTQSWPGREVAAIVGLRANRTRATQLVEALRSTTQPLFDPAGPPPPAGGTVVVVLGMHRAGTSLCTRIIQRLGIELGGPLLAPGFENQDGYQEHREIVECHRELLELMDAQWDTILLVQPPSPEFWRSEPVVAIRDRLERLVAEQVKAAGGVWAFKDPRAARLLPLWREIFDDLGVRPVWILSVRDPRAVAASLFIRDGIPLPLGELLWVEHYLDALRHLGPGIDAVVHYEKWFSAPSVQLRTLAAAVGRASDDAIEAAGRSIRADLRHNRPDQDPWAFGLAARVQSWLLAEHPDLSRIQRAAEAMWLGLAATVRNPDQPSQVTQVSRDLVDA